MSRRWYPAREYGKRQRYALLPKMVDECNEVEGNPVLKRLGLDEMLPLLLKNACQSIVHVDVDPRRELLNGERRTPNSEVEPKLNQWNVGFTTTCTAIYMWIERVELWRRPMAICGLYTFELFTSELESGPQWEIDSRKTLWGHRLPSQELNIVHMYPLMLLLDLMPLFISGTSLAHSHSVVAQGSLTSEFWFTLWHSYKLLRRSHVYYFSWLFLHSRMRVRRSREISSSKLLVLEHNA